MVRLGLKAAKILSIDRLFDIDEEDDRPDEEKLGGSFAFKFNENLHIGDKTAAKFSLAQINEGIETVKRAFRSLTFDPIAAGLRRQAELEGGPVPPRLAKQLAGFQDALLRLQALNQSSGVNLSI